MGSIIEADHATGNWIFSKEEIEKNTPSRKDGIDAKKEAWLRKGCCTFIQDAGMRLKVPQLTIATAIMFCHRFFMRQSYAEQDRYVIASTCLFLAGKVEDTPRQLKDVIYITYIIRHKKDKGAEDRIKQSREVFEHERELLLAGEYLVMNTLSFDLNINHPYKPLLSTIRKFDKEGPLKHLAQVSWNFVNDGLRTSLGLQFRPHEVAAGAIYLAAKFLKISLPQQDGKPWWTEFQVTPNILEDVSSQMLELYEQTKDGSGTTGASSRRYSKGHAPAKSAGGAKSKGGHPTTPSVADRPAQASLTSGASVAPSAAPLPPAAGAAKEKEAGPADLAAVGAPAVVPAGRKPEPGRDKEPGMQAGAAAPLGENGHVAAASAGAVVAAPGAAAPTEGGKPGADGQDGAPGAQVAASAVKGPEVAVFPEAVHHENFASKSSGATVEANGATSMSSLGAEGAREAAQAGPLVDAGGEALDEPMDVDEGPAAPSTAAGDSGKVVQSHAAQAASPGRDRPGLLPETGAPRSAGGEAAAGPRAEAHSSREQGERAGMAAPQQEGGRPGHAGAHGSTDRGGGETKLVVGATSEWQAPTAPASQALERVSEEGEIPSEEGEIPSSPVAHEVRSPANASRERERDGRARSRSRSHSRDHSQSPPSPRRRRAAYHSRSKSPSEPARGRSPSPYSSGGKRHKNGQRRRDWDKVRGGGGPPLRDAGDRGHWNRDRDRDRGRDRDRDRNRERDRDRDRQGAHRSHKDPGRHRGLQYTDSADRRR